jgi:hypothetical protein
MKLPGLQRAAIRKAAKTRGVYSDEWRTAVSRAVKFLDQVEAS